MKPAFLEGLTDRDVLALTIWAEARNQSLDGQTAVAFVILNRVRSGRWGSTIKAVCWARRQFSCWAPLEGERNYEALLARCRAVLAGTPEKGGPALRQAFWVADGALGGALINRIGEACHYLNPRAVRRLPAWADPTKRTASLGDHDFYSGVA